MNTQRLPILRWKPFTPSPTISVALRYPERAWPVHQRRSEPGYPSTEPRYPSTEPGYPST
eukprot:1424988-Pyramimonas_sp.AAC.1